MKREHTEPNPCTEADCLLPGGWVYERDHKHWRPANPDDQKHRRCWAHGPGKVRPEIARRSKRTQPNARIQVAAAILLAEARETTTALEWIHEELSVLGFPATSDASGVSSGGLSDRTEADATRAHQLTAWREECRDAIGEVERVVLDLRKWRQRVTGKPTAADEPLCSDRQKGRGGVLEWGDATCTELGTEDGLCAACYQAERRWRKRAGMTDRKAESAA